MTQTTIRKRRAYSPSGDVGRKLRRAEELTAQIAKLQQQLEPIREDILKHLIKQDLAFIEAGDFTAIRKQRHKWEYSIHTKNEMEAIRNKQKWEQLQGIAHDTPTTFLQLSAKR